MGNKVKIGLLGAGRIGKLHGENLAHAIPNADLYAVADASRRTILGCTAETDLSASALRSSGRV